MNKKSKSISKSKFLSQNSRKEKREIFEAGDWINIQENLTLFGWDSIQRELIHSSLKSGLPLNYAVRNAALKIGSCPLNSKPFF
tara:strand:- start:306 stop:557 length:252 start_codon:yes stop_codon:yes gene_type:complete